MSFVMLTESQVTPGPMNTENPNQADQSRRPKDDKFRDSPSDTTLSRQVESAQQLFEILSSRSDVDYPICEECTDLLVSSFQARLNASTKERDAYITFVKSLNNNAPTPAEVSEAQAALSAAKSAESAAFAELVSLEQKKSQVEDEIAKLEAEGLALDEDERDFWTSRNAFSLELSSFQNRYDALSAAYDHDAKQLERLQRTNVYNDSFSVGHDGFFGTINGLRLGRLPPPQNVDWSEINAAWGAAALLLATVAERLGFSFRGYRIKPMGSTSTIERLEYPSPQQSAFSTSRSVTASDGAQSQPKVTSLDLFSSGDLPLGRMLLHRRLDAGMVAFLDCLRQIGEFVERGSKEQTSQEATSIREHTGRLPVKDAEVNRTALRLPYTIKKDKIGDASIKLSVSTDETWTRACKYALTCCKYLLAHASNVGFSVPRAA